MKKECDGIIVFNVVIGTHVQINISACIKNSDSKFGYR